MDFRDYVRAHLPALGVPREDEIVEELAEHLEEAYHDRRSAGLDHEAARAEATSALPQAAEALATALRQASQGPVARAAHTARRRLEEPPPPSSGAVLAGLGGDFRYGLRNLFRHRGFAATAILSLALGLGANSALFSMFNSVLWRPLPVISPDDLVVMYRRNPTQTYYDAFSYAEYRDYREHTGPVFSGLAGYGIAEVALGSVGAKQDAATRVIGELVTGSYFDVLGVTMGQGRGFISEEDQDGGPLSAVVSHGFWQTRLRADPAVVGRTITLNNLAFTIVGVAPESFRGLYAVYLRPELWITAAAAPRLEADDRDFLTDRTATSFRLVGRLAPGVSRPAAQAAVDTVAARLATAYPDTNKDMKAFVFDEIDARPEVEMAPSANIVARIFLGLTGLVLLIACANVANLLLARAASRRKEIAIRMAIGAGRTQLIRQLLVESLLLAAVSGLFAVGLGALATNLLASLRVPTDFPLELVFHTDLAVAAYTFTLATFAAVVFGLWPAWQLSRTNLVPALKDEGSSKRRTRRRVNLSDSLVAMQVAASCVVLVVAGLFVRSVGGARNVDPGFALEDRMVIALNPGLRGFDDTDTKSFYRRGLEAVRTLPGVIGASLAQYVPLDYSIDGGEYEVEGRAPEPGSNGLEALASAVDDSYFSTLATPIVRGRAFTAGDQPDSVMVAIVNATFAEKAWPGQTALGRRIRRARPDAPWLEVVGVSGDGKYRGLTESPRPFVWTALAQQEVSSATLVVWSRREATAALGEVRRALAAIDPTVPVYDAKSMDAFMARAYLGPRLASLIVGPAALCALIIAAVGLYGVLAYWVSRKTREIGVRAALGASPTNLVAMVMRQGLALAFAGVGLGLLAAAGMARLVGSFLIGISPTDPLVFASVPAVLLLVAAAASFMPARTAVRVDPVEALRQA